MENNILVIGIAGGTGSGKTTLMDNIIRQFGDVVTVLSHDNYYRRRDELTYEQRTRQCCRQGITDKLRKQRRELLTDPVGNGESGGGYSGMGDERFAQGFPTDPVANNIDHSGGEGRRNLEPMV